MLESIYMPEEYEVAWRNILISSFPVSHKFMHVARASKTYVTIEYTSPSNAAWAYFKYQLFIDVNEPLEKSTLRLLDGSQILRGTGIRANAQAVSTLSEILLMVDRPSFDVVLRKALANLRTLDAEMPQRKRYDKYGVTL